MPSNEFYLPFGESRRAKTERIDTKALGRNLAARVARRLVDRPSIGKRRGRGGRDIDLPTGGNPGKRRPTGSNFDPDNDGWVDEGTTRPRFVGTNEQLATGMRRRAATQSRAIVQTRKKPITETSQEDKAKQASKKRILLSSGSRKDVTQWERVGGQKGSNEGGFYRDENGEMFYVKWPKENLQSETEVLANQLYKMADVYVPDIEIAQDSQGAEVVVSKVIPGIDPIYPGNASQEEIDELASNFIFDAWLSNWDSVLSANSNRTPDGRAVRIDTGGALLFRAQGARKGDRFGETVGEIDTMRDYDMTEAAGIFGELTDEQLTEQAGRLAKLDPRDIEDKTRELISDQEEQDNLVNLLLARRKDILDRFGVDDPYEGRATRSGKLSSGSRKIDDKTILKHRRTAYKYGDKSVLSGKPMRAYNRGWLAGLTSKQMAALLVPDSEDAFLDIITDQLIGETAFSRGLSAKSFAKSKRDELKEAIKTAVRENRGLSITTDPLFTPEEVGKTRLSLERALDNSPGLKWAMQRFGSPPFRSNSTDSGRDEATGVTTTAYYAPLFGITLLESFHAATPDWNADGPKLRDWSIDNSQVSSFIHEWGHYLETSIKRLSESSRFGDYFIDPSRTGVRQAVAVDIDHHMFRGGHFDRTRVGEPADIGAPGVARLSSILYSTHKLPQGQLLALLATMNMENGLFSRDAKTPGLITAYGNSSATEMFPEALTAIMHPNLDVETRSITEELSKTVRYALGISLDTEDRPWLAFAQREKEFIERTTPNARTAQRTGPATRRVISDQKLSSGSRKKPVRKIESIEDYLEDNFDEPDVVTDEFIDSSFEVFDKVEGARKTIEELKNRGLSKEKVLTEIGKRPELLGPIVLNGYVGDRYKTINQFARGQTDAEEYFDSINFADLDGRVGPTVKTAKALQAMDHMFETSATKMPKKGVVYRGMIVDDDDAEEHFSEFVVGSRFRDDGFVSTSVDPQVASRFGGDDYPDYELEGKTRVVMKVTVPKGMDVLVTNGLPDRLGNEGELVLQRGLEYQVTSVTDITDPLDMGRPILFVEVRALPKKAAKTSKSTQKLSSGSRKLSNSEIVENDITAGIRDHQAGDISFGELLERGWYEAQDPSGEILYTPFEEFPYHKDTYQSPSDELKTQAVAEKARRVIARPIDLSQVNSQKQYSMRVLAEHIMKDVIEALLDSKQKGTHEYDTGDGLWRINATLKRIREQYPTGIPTEGRSDGTSTPLVPLEKDEIQQVFDLFDWGALKEMLDEIVKHAMIEEYKGGGYVNLRKYAVAGMDITPDGGLRAMEGQRKLYLTIKDIPYIGLEVRTDAKLFVTPLNAYPVHETTIPTEYGATLMNAALENLAVRVVEPTTLYRGIKQITRPRSTIMSDDLKLADEKLQELLDSLVPGLEFESSTFLSTTLSAPQGQIFAGWKDPGVTSVMLAIDVPQGQKALVGTSGETELILPPGSQFKVVSVERTASPTSGLQRIFARLELIPESERSDGPVRKLASGSRSESAYKKTGELIDDYNDGKLTYTQFMEELKSISNKLFEEEPVNAEFESEYFTKYVDKTDGIVKDLALRVVARPVDTSGMPEHRIRDFDKVARLVSKEVVKARLALGYPYSREDVRDRVAKRIARFKEINAANFDDLTRDEQKLSLTTALVSDEELDQIVESFDFDAIMDIADIRMMESELGLYIGADFAFLRSYSLGQIDDSPLSGYRSIRMPEFGIRPIREEDATPDALRADSDDALRAGSEKYEISPSGIIQLLTDKTKELMPRTMREEIAYRGMRLEASPRGDKEKQVAFEALVDALVPGSVFESSSFGSSSVHYLTSTRFARLTNDAYHSVMLAVRVPRGTHVIIGNTTENEFVLPAGAKYRVISVKKAKGREERGFQTKSGDKIIAEVELLPSDSDVVPDVRLSSGSRGRSREEQKLIDIVTDEDAIADLPQAGPYQWDPAKKFIDDHQPLAIQAKRRFESEILSKHKEVVETRIFNAMAAIVKKDYGFSAEEQEKHDEALSELFFSSLDIIAQDPSLALPENRDRLIARFDEYLDNLPQEVLDKFGADSPVIGELKQALSVESLAESARLLLLDSMRSHFTVTGAMVLRDYFRNIQSGLPIPQRGESRASRYYELPVTPAALRFRTTDPDWSYDTFNGFRPEKFDDGTIKNTKPVRYVDMEPAAKAQIMDIAATELAIRLPDRPVTLYRGMQRQGFRRGNEAELLEADPDTETPFVKFIRNMKPGAVFSSDLLSSTSHDMIESLKFAEFINPTSDSIFMIIRTESGEKLILGNDLESESIIPAGRQMRVIDVKGTKPVDSDKINDTTPGKWVVEVELVPKDMEVDSDGVVKLSSGSRENVAYEKAEEIFDALERGDIDYNRFIVLLENIAYEPSVMGSNFRKDHYRPMKSRLRVAFDIAATKVLARPINTEGLSDVEIKRLDRLSRELSLEIQGIVLNEGYPYSRKKIKKLILDRIAEIKEEIATNSDLYGGYEKYEDYTTEEIDQIFDTFNLNGLIDIVDITRFQAELDAYTGTGYKRLRKYAIDVLTNSQDVQGFNKPRRNAIDLPEFGIKPIPSGQLVKSVATYDIKPSGIIKFLSDMSLKFMAETQREEIVYRGIRSPNGMSDDPEQIEFQRLIESLEPGAVFDTISFGSSSLDYGMGTRFSALGDPRTDSVILTVRVPRGEKILIGSEEEQEFILPAGHKYRVTSVRKFSGRDMPDGKRRGTKIIAEVELLPADSDEIPSVKLASGSRAKAKEILDIVGSRQIEFKQPIQSRVAFTVGYDAHDVARSILTRIKINDDLLARKSSVDDRILQLIQDNPSVLGLLIQRWTKNRDEGNENRSLNKLMRELYRKLIEDDRAADLTSLPDRVSRLSDWVIRYGGRGQSIPTSQIDDLLDELDSVDLEIVNQVMRDNPVLALWSAHSYYAYIPDVSHLADPDEATESDLVASLVKANNTTQLAADIEKLGVTAEEAQDVIDLLGPIVQASAIKIGDTYKSRTGQDASPIVLLANEVTKQWARTAGDNATPSILVQVIAGRILPELTGSGTEFIDYASTLDGDTPDSEGIGKIRKRTLDEAMELADNPLVAKVIGAILTSQWARTQEYLDRIAPNGTVQLHRGMTHQGIVRDILVQNRFARRTPEEIATLISSTHGDAEEALREFKAITEEHNDKVAAAQERYVKLVTLTQKLDRLQESSSAKDREEAANIRRQIAEMKQSYRDLQEEIAKLKTESEERRDSAERAIGVLERHVDVARSISGDSWYGIIDTRQLPLSSTATAQASTVIFSGENPEISSGDAPVMITMSVPNTSILSTAVTGFGCLEENEFIISHPILRDVTARVEYGLMGDWELESLTESYEFGQMIGLDFSSIATLVRRELPKV